MNTVAKEAARLKAQIEQSLRLSRFVTGTALAGAATRRRTRARFSRERVLPQRVCSRKGTGGTSLPGQTTSSTSAGR